VRVYKGRLWALKIFLRTKEYRYMAVDDDLNLLLLGLMILGGERNVSATYVRGRELWGD